MLPLASTAGMLACCLVCVGIGMSMWGYVGPHGDRYSVLNHFISELGRTTTSPFAFMFNGSLIATGLLLLVFAIGLRQLFDGWQQYVVGALSLTAFLACVLVGVFPVGKLLFQHLVVASVFFPTALALALAVSGFTLLAPDPALPKWTAGFGLLAGAAFAALVFAPHDTLMAFLHDPHFVRPSVWPLCLLEWACLATVLLWINAVAVAMRSLASQP